MKKNEIIMEMGGPVQISWKKIGKSSQSSPILVLIFWGSITCVYTLSNYSHYDLRVLSMSVLG